ncbi:hypothetical protein IQ289_30865 [Burkholderia sp. R-70006]|nr:hypothetical protein [Paraburkholderia domus]MBK5052785.1 hypothetical protein [Burkholderia sp. R-70006]
MTPRSPYRSQALAAGTDIEFDDLKAGDTVYAALESAPAAQVTQQVAQAR